jgi:hypothetical protein
LTARRIFRVDRIAAPARSARPEAALRLSRGAGAPGATSIED